MIKIGIIGDHNGCSGQIMTAIDGQNLTSNGVEIYLTDHTSIIPLLNERNINYYTYDTVAKINTVVDNVQLVFLINPSDEVLDKVDLLVVEKNIPIILCNF